MVELSEAQKKARAEADAENAERQAEAAGETTSTTLGPTEFGAPPGVEDSALLDWDNMPPEVLAALTGEVTRTSTPKAVEVQGTSTGEPWSAGAYPTITEYPRGDRNKYFPVGEAPEGPLREGPQYSNIEYQLILNGMNTSELAALELMFQEAGMIDPEAMLSNGLSRGSLLGHFKSLIEEADSNRNSWEDQLNNNIEVYQEWLKENPEEKPKTWAQLNPFIAPAEMKPDYASLAQNVKDNIRGQLGRSATDGEMELLTNQLAGSFHDAWKQNQYDPALANWEARSRAHETGATTGTTGTFQEVDPMARFDEVFDERYENELGHRRRVDAGKQKTNSLFGSFDMLSRSI